MWLCLWGDWRLADLYTKTLFLSVNLEIFVHLVLNMVLQMLLKILLRNFFQCIYCQRATRVLDFRFLSTSYHNSKTPSDATQRQMFLQLRETYFRQTTWCSWCLFNFIQALCYSFLLKYPKWLGSDCLEVFFLLHTSLHCTMVLLGQTGLGVIQGCQTYVEMALDLNHIQLVMGVSPGEKNSVFLSISYKSFNILNPN